MIKQMPEMKHFLIALATVTTIASPAFAWEPDLTPQLKQVEAEIIELNEQITTLDKQIDDNEGIYDRLDNINENLYSFAEKFLHLPYDQYNIEELALPALKKSGETEAEAEYLQLQELLANYGEHTLQLRNFLKENDGKPTKDAIDAIKKLEVYQKYLKYDKRLNTFIGSILHKATDEQLKRNSATTDYSKLIPLLDKIEIEIEAETEVGMEQEVEQE